MRRIRLARGLIKLAKLLTIGYPMHSSVGLQNQPFFVLGSGRNGSTLLNRMLNQHSALFLPSEQYFLGNSIIKYQLYPFLIWRDLMKVIGGELYPSTGSHTWQMSGDEVINDLFMMEEKCLQNVIDAIFRSYGSRSKSDFQKWGDTTPLNTIYLPEVYSLFPKAKYIFLVRDGRDVMASYNKAGVEFLGDLAETHNGARHWNHSIEKYDWLAKRTDVLLVRYEALVTEPERILMEICAHLGLEFEVQMLDFHKDTPNSQMYTEPQHSNIQKPIATTSIGNWSKQLKSEDAAAVASITKNLKRFGYE
jgi:protein-tyrosine sulfotransferase